MPPKNALVASRSMISVAASSDANCEVKERLCRSVTRSELMSNLLLKYVSSMSTMEEAYPESTIVGELGVVDVGDGCDELEEVASSVVMRIESSKDGGRGVMVFESNSSSPPG